MISRIQNFRVNFFPVFIVLISLLLSNGLAADANQGPEEGTMEDLLNVLELNATDFESTMATVARAFPQKQARKMRRPMVKATTRAVGRAKRPAPKEGNPQAIKSPIIKKSVVVAVATRPPIKPPTTKRLLPQQPPVIKKSNVVVAVATKPTPTTKSLLPQQPVTKKSNVVVSFATKPTTTPSPVTKPPVVQNLEVTVATRLTTPSTSTNTIFEEKSIPPSPPTTTAEVPKSESTAPSPLIEPRITSFKNEETPKATTPLAITQGPVNNEVGVPTPTPSPPEVTESMESVKTFLHRPELDELLKKKGITTTPHPPIHMENDSQVPNFEEDDHSTSDQLLNNTITITTSPPITTPPPPPVMGVLGFLAQLGGVPDSATPPTTTTTTTTTSTTTTTVSAMVEIIYDDVDVSKIHPDILAHVRADLIFHEKLEDHQKGTVSLTGNKTLVM